jgi:uncharacterized glyoxalase superfamily protein PhnB
MTDTTPAKTVWPCVNYRDAPAAIRFLVEAFGFEQRCAYTGEGDAYTGEGDAVIAHAELAWPEGGGVMLGSADRAESVFSQRPTGAASLYVVTDAPDALFERAMAAGAELLREMRDEEYGSRGFSVRDPEGNFWSFGTYRGE